MKKILSVFYLLFWTFLVINAQEPCDQSYGGVGAYSSPIGVSDAQDNISAIDIVLEPGISFLAEKLKVNVSSSGMPFGLSFAATFYDEELGEQLGTTSLTITNGSATTPGVWSLELALDEPMYFAPGSAEKRYWIGLTAATTGSSQIGWTAVPYTDDGSNLPVHYSSDGGVNWSTTIPGADGLVEASVKVMGTCEEVEVEDPEDPEEPDESYPCDQSYGAVGGYSVSILTNESVSNMAAIDVRVDAGINFTVEKLQVSLATMGMPVGTFTAHIFDEDLSEIIATSNLVAGLPVSVSPGVWKLDMDLSDPVTLEAGAVERKYWIGLTGSPAMGGELRWKAADFTDDGSNLPLHYSSDGGVTWSTAIPGVEGLIEASVKVMGMCEEVEVEDPEDPDTTNCSQGVPSNNFESMANANKFWNKAVDIIVDSNEDFLLEQLEIHVGTSPNAPITHLDIYYYEDDNGLPGKLMESELGIVPVSTEWLHNFSEYYSIYKVIVNVTPMMFEGRVGNPTTYWLRAVPENAEDSETWWETSSKDILGHYIANLYNGNWSVLTGMDGVYQMRGQCYPIVEDSDCNTIFTDSGGVDSNYDNNEQQVWHLMPTQGNVIAVEFLSFATEEGMDGLMIYDGPDTDSQILSSGYITGNETCPNGAWHGTGDYSAEGRTFISSHPSGMLTFVFTSNGDTTAEGWVADVTCLPQGSAGNCIPGKLQTTFQANATGLGAQMFNITSLSDEVMEIREFDIHMTSGRTKTIEVYYRPGGYEGYEYDPSEWTLLGSQVTSGRGNGTATELRIGGLRIPAGETYGIYITMADYVLGEGVTFPVEINSNETYSNDKIIIHPGIYGLGGYFFYPDEPMNDAVWQGVIYYCEGGEDQSYEQPCLSAEYGQYPNFTYEPGCYGYKEDITRLGWRGEYSKVRVSSGVEYTFESSNPSDHITISDELGVVPFEFGTGSITWIPEFNGEVRFYTHTNENCGHNNSGVVSRSVTCGELYIPQAPDYDCYFGDGLASNGFEAGGPIQYEGIIGTADDFVVNSDIFIAQEIRMNIISEAPVTEGRFSFFHHVEGPAGWGPGYAPFLTTNFIQPSKQIEIGRIASNQSLKVYEVTFDLPMGIEFEKGTTWLLPEIIGVKARWELTSTGSSGSYMQNAYFDEGYWNPVEGMNAVFFIAGDCTDVSVGTEDNHWFSYYPNPVSDVLYFNSNKHITMAKVFNVLGVNVMTIKEPQESVNVSILPSGLYIVNTYFDDGSVKTLRIQKN